MAPPKSSFKYVNLHGEALGGPKDLLRGKQRSMELRADAAAARPVAASDLETVFDALCVAGSRRGKGWLMHFLLGAAWRRADGSAFRAAEVSVALRRLCEAERIDEVEGQGFAVPEAALRPRLTELLRRDEAANWWRVWAWAGNGAHGPPDAPPGTALLRSDAERLALARLVLAAGLEAPEFNRVAQLVMGSAAGAGVLLRALTQPFDAGFIERMRPSLCWGLLASLDSQGSQVLAGQPELMAWIDDALRRSPAPVPAPLRLRVAERRLHSGDFEGVAQALTHCEPLTQFVPLFDAALMAWRGEWEQAPEAFAQALKTLGKSLGARRSLAPPSLLQWYPLALLAQPLPGAWATARKFCIAESGSRSPEARHGWGLWAHAIAVRLGDEPLQPEVLDAPVARWIPFDASANADRCILAAWLGHVPKGWTGALLTQTAQALELQGLAWKAELLRQACERLGWQAPPRAAGASPVWPGHFFGAPQEAWRDALAAISALGGGASATAADPLVTLQWCLTLDAQGRVADIVPFERAPGPRSKARIKPLSLAQLKKRVRLDGRDAAVARCLSAPSYAPRDLRLDLAAAAGALVGHPDLCFADAPLQPVELHEGLPTLEVRRERAADGGECYRFHLDEALVAAPPPIPADRWRDDDYDERETERRNSLRIVRESAERAKLIRIGPAQRRVAELVAKAWSVPLDAQAELDAALRVLSGHFVLHSDAAGGEAVAPQARLRAQLIPRGDGLELRLVVRPFGAFGPSLAPGAGRARLITLHQGLSLATLRELELERGHLATVLEALPWLGETNGDAVWLIDDPEQCLAAVQALGQLEAVAALEWPRGQPLRVVTPAAKGLKLTLRSGRDWFALQGELALDEQRVLGLQQLMELLRGARQGRFVALGDGEYLALTERLRQQLADLDALAVSERDELRVPAAAAAWLAETFDELDARGDPAWKRRLARLDEAAALQPALPATLLAQLRPYQVEGHAWLARLAHAGFGACLADDMGLGKTVQTLALLLDRAATGAALVLAPTSVCANWAAEAARFAPTLRVLEYAGGEREALLAQAGAGDLLVASYALVLRDAEAFGQRAWGTLVLDEAQALKNAATKRAQAVAALDAGFRLALTGTPVENRLADLWSIMNLLNPGLLGNAARFAERFGNPIERHRNEAVRARLRRLVGPFFLRRTKAQVLPDLPPRTEIVHRVQPGPEEMAFLEAARRGAVERIAALEAAGGDTAFNALAELTRLRRAACDPRLVAPELGLVGAKVQEFERLAGELVAGRHQALVFSQFTSFLKLLGERLAAAGIAYQYLDGATPAEQRAGRVAAFQRGEGDLFLISLKAGGFGLNLTAADYVIIADPWWNPAAEDQAMGRAHRIGQQRPVTVYRLVTAGSVEERIVELHRDKRALAEGLLEGQDGAAPLRAAELLDLLRG